MYSNATEKAISDQAIEWFTKLHSGQATHDDRDRFEAWIKTSPFHAKAYADVEAFWALLDAPARRVSEQGQTPVRGGVAGKRLALLSLPLAAALAALLWLPGVLRHWGSDWHTGWGETREIVLEDGSRVGLNTHSALSANFSPRQRLLKLAEGEAFFDVAHDSKRPLVVATAHGFVKAVGTSFNVYEQADRVTVTVSEGRVRVYADGAENQAVEVTAGFQVSGDAQGIGHVLAVDSRQALAWRDGLLVFDRKPLAVVVSELNRYLSGRAVIADPRLGQLTVSGVFDLSDPAGALEAIEKNLKLESLRLSKALIILYPSHF